MKAYTINIVLSLYVDTFKNEHSICITLLFYIVIQYGLKSNHHFQRKLHKWTQKSSQERMYV